MERSLVSMIRRLQETGIAGLLGRVRPPAVGGALPWNHTSERPRERRTYRHWRNDRRGVVAIMFALLVIPLLLTVGAGVDLTRATTFRTALQGAADSAALAGAAAYVDATSTATASAVASAYMQNAESALPVNKGVTFSVSTQVVTGSSGQTTGYSVTVNASGTIGTSLMSLVMPSMGASVTATALNPIVNFSVSIGNWKSSAWDANTIYWYVVPDKGALPTSSQLHEMFTNTGPEPSSVPSIGVTAGQKVGFALENVTGGIHGYGSNQYGSPQGHTNWFYSQLSPPSQSAYPSEAKNCSLQVVTATSSDPNPTETPGSCSTGAMPQLATVDCAKAAGKTIYYFWNDMGGGTDDYDYNDAQYSLSCSNASGASGSSGPTSVVLTN